MVPEKYIISLIMKGDNPPSMIIWFCWEQAGQHTPNGQTKPSVKVMYVDFRNVLCHFPQSLQC